MLLPVEHDTFFIAARIREIDPDYRIYYNMSARRYEVHAKGQGGNTLCLVVPYKELDARTLTLARKTRVARMDALIAETERENLKRSGGIFA